MMMQKIRGKNESGFTLIELMIVIAIIGILAAIAIPNFIAYRKRGYHSSANSDAKNAYTAAQAYFSDYPLATVDSLAKLTSAGFQPTESVTLDVAGDMDNLAITTYHGSGDYTYTVGPTGEITEQQP